MLWLTVPLDLPPAEVRVVVTQTTSVVSGSSSDSPQLIVREPVSGLIAATPSGAEQAVAGFVDFIKDVAANLLVNPEKEAAVERHFAELVKKETSRPLKRRAK